MTFQNKTTNKELERTREAKSSAYVICAFIMPVSSGGAEDKACQYSVKLHTEMETELP